MNAEYHYLKQLVDDVVEMRKLQKEYFKTRDKEVLQRSKEREKHIDEFLAYLARFIELLDKARKEA